MAGNLERLLTQDQVKEFIRRRAARALPQFEILACFPQGNDSLFFLHLRDPSSQAELLLPVSGLWVQDASYVAILLTSTAPLIWQPRFLISNRPQDLRATERCHPTYSSVKAVTGTDLS